MKKYYVIDGHDKVYTEREFANLSYWFKGKRHKCLGTFKNREEAEEAWWDEIMYPGIDKINNIPFDIKAEWLKEERS